MHKASSENMLENVQQSFVIPPKLATSDMHALDTQYHKYV